jgi:spectinomycin phosphotransferase
MLEKPLLPDTAVLASVQAAYAVRAVTLDFLPIGNDASAWVYRVQADESTRWFLKIRKGPVSEPSVAVPYFLKTAGIDTVVAPLPARSGQLWSPVDETFTAILYPYIEGQPGMEIGLTADQWVALGAALRRIHQAALPPALAQQVRNETFQPAWAPIVARLDATIRAGIFDDPTQAELATFWQSRQAEIDQLVRRAAQLGQMLQQQSPDRVLCHSDIHTANVLIDAAGSLHIVDWDQPQLAPKERDLMFVIDSATARTPAEICFFEGYGPVTIDPLALAYYRYEWVVQEIGDFGERVFFSADGGAATRQDALRGFMQLFDPGDVVESAYAADSP